MLKNVVKVSCVVMFLASCAKHSAGEFPKGVKHTLVERYVVSDSALSTVRGQQSRVETLSYSDFSREKCKANGYEKGFLGYKVYDEGQQQSAGLLSVISGASSVKTQTVKIWCKKD